MSRDFILGKPKMEDELLKEKVLKYEHFLNETLRTDLKTILDRRDQVYSETAEYLQLKSIIERLRQDTPSTQKNLKTKIDLGCNFYCQANVPDASMITVCIGHGFYVEFTLDEAIKFIDKKTNQLTEKSDVLTKDAAKVKAHIKLVLQALKEIQMIGDSKFEQTRQGLWD
ncbi:unnamed protein product [Owenia fusiformis]|uniref:Protein UXT n=1 Tax=Owenia fusiformis TaxID=6347 RepID=A0A8S4NPC4_OWEFU|nr:unnamed protein product [Owenia fusiformis]